jgi:hypothetical protein
VEDDPKSKVLVSYKVGVTTLDQFYADKWNAKDPFLSKLGIIGFRSDPGSHTVEFEIGTSSERNAGLGDINQQGLETALSMARIGVSSDSNTWTFGAGAVHLKFTSWILTSLEMPEAARTGAPSASAAAGTINKGQGQDGTAIKDPAEFDSYETAIKESDPKIRAAALEAFLQAYPGSAAKRKALDQLVVIYQGLNDGDKALNASGRLLQIDPENLKALYMSVFIKKIQCGKTLNRQTCEDSATLARKGLLALKPTDISDEGWKKLTGSAYPIFHSAIALDDVNDKKDFRTAISEYRIELMLFSPMETTRGQALGDTLDLANAYTESDAKDLALAVWFYARVWNFANANFKAQIETKIEYYYKRIHGGLDGLDAVKAQAAATVFPPPSFQISGAALSN